MPAGTLILKNGSTIVTGSSTDFTKEVKPGDFIGVIVGGTPYTMIVQSVDSSTQITLPINYVGPDASGVAWYAMPASLKYAITQQSMNDLSNVYRSMITEKKNWQSIFSSQASVTVTLPDNSTFTGPSWGGLSNQLSNKVTTGSSAALSGLSIKSATPTISFMYGNAASATSRLIQYESATVALVGANLRAPAFKIGDYSSGTLGFGSFSGIGCNYLSGGPVHLPSGILSSNGSGTTTASAYSWYWNGSMNLFVDGTNLGYLSLNTSDRSLKRDIEGADLSEDMEVLRKLNPVSFYWKDNPDKTQQRGFIAQDAYDTSPDLAMESLGLWGLKPFALISRAVGAIKHLDDTVSQQQEVINSLSKKLDDIEKTLATK